MIYIFDDLQTLTKDMIQQACQILPRQRMEKISCYHFERDRNLGITAYLLLHYGLKLEYGIDEPVEFDLGLHGKPSLKKYPDIHFSISHCRAGALCSISDAPVGADIQEIENTYSKVMRRVMTEKEISIITDSPCPDIAFTTFWVLKECYIKYLGTGLSEELRKLDFSETYRTNRFRDCFCRHRRTARYCYSNCTAAETIPAVNLLTAEQLFR